MPSTVRRSGRERKANPKYVDTGWDQKTLRLLRESSESSGSSPSDDSDVEVELQDDNFEVPVFDDIEESSSDEEQLSDTPSDSSTRTPGESDDDQVSVASHEADTPRRKQSHLPRVVGGLPKDTGHGRSRGIPSVHRKGSKHVVYPQIFGPDVIDLKPVLTARNTWLKGRDITLPGRMTLTESKHQPSIAHDLVASLAIEQPVDEISGSQDLDILDKDTASTANYLIANPSEQSVVLGPVGKQQLFKSRYLETVDVSQAWSEATAVHVPDELPSASASLPQADTKDHRGWIVNAGEKIRCLAWLPGNDEDEQYLAVACRSSSKQRSAGPPFSTARSPAFHPSSSYASSIQLWSIKTGGMRADSETTEVVSESTPPRLSLLCGIDMGDIRQILWQPTNSSSPSKAMAVLSTDGSVRLLSFDLPVASGNQTTYGRMQTPLAKIVAPPDIVFSAMCWMSTTDLVLGGSDGTIRVYNISNDAGLEPYLTVQLHNTYILSLVSTFPSDTPTFLAATTASGDLLLTDLRAPDQEIVHAQASKARLPTKPLIYCPLTRSFVSIVDSSGRTDPRGPSTTFVNCHHLRHFYGSHQLCRLPAMSGAGTALAGSCHHPCILGGNAKGSVFATNYVRRALPGKTKPAKSMGGFMQKLCDYDWRPLSPSEMEPDQLNQNPKDQIDFKDDIDLFHSHDVRPGISRYTEGFLPEHIDLTTGGHRRTRLKQKRSRRSSGTDQAQGKHRKRRIQEPSESAPDVIFEEEQAVTALEWNPNRRSAGWAAIGWGSGLVRVMDLSHDAE
jgi:transcription factor C subunit 6